ncbi:rod shape-determining protein, partial [Streptomyces sp. T-3]|nr:rod shape-determining protein [Streptomyces sp. T-3]
RTALRDAAPQSRTQTAGGTVCLPDDAGSVQAQALLDVCHGAGLRHVRLVPKSLAAAAGAGIPLEEPAGALLVDVGADRTSAAMLSFGGVISTRGVAVGSATVDTALMRFLRRRHGLVICAAEAERAKVRIGEALATTGTVPVHGQDLQRGLPDTRNIPAAELAEVARDTVEGIARLTLSLLADSPAELVDDVLDRGLVLCGEGARTYGLDDHLRERVNLPVHVPDQPGDLGVRGAWRVSDI